MMHGEWFFACLRYDFCNAAAMLPQHDISSRLEIYPIIDGDILVFLWYSQVNEVPPL